MTARVKHQRGMPTVRGEPVVCGETSRRLDPIDSIFSSCTFFDARPESTPRRCCDLGAQLMIFYSTAQSMRLSTTGGTGSFLRKQPLRSLHSTCDHLMAFPSRRFQHAHALVLCCYRHRRDAVAPPEWCVQYRPRCYMHLNHAVPVLAHANVVLRKHSTRKQA